VRQHYEKQRRFDCTPIGELMLNAGDVRECPRESMSICRFLLFLLLLSMRCSPLKPEHVAHDQDETPTEQRPHDGQHSPRKIAATYLPNPVMVHPKVISGGLPEGDNAFQELQSLGVKTIISVDGMKPDVDTASKFGLRYVHLPHGYDGVPSGRVKELAKAVRSLDGPIYIHCHHGKHRSPAAASIACVGAGLISKSMALAVLELAGTSPNYRGHFDSARRAKPLETAFLENAAFVRVVVYTGVAVGTAQQAVMSGTFRRHMLCGRPTPTI